MYFFNAKNVFEKYLESSYLLILLLLIYYCCFVSILEFLLPSAAYD